MKRTIEKIFFISLLLFLSCGREMIRESEESQKIYNLFEEYRSESWEVRKASLEKLAPLSSKKFSSDIDDFFCEATYDVHPAVRIEALKGLKKRKPQSCLERIRAATTTDPNPNVVLYGYRALAAYRDTASAPQFVHGLSSSDWMIREASIRGLMKIRDKNEKMRYLNQINKSLRDPNESVRIATLNSLSIRDRSLYLSIVENFNVKNSRKITVLKASLKAVRGYNLDQKTRTFMIELLSHENVDIRVLALRALKKDSSLKSEEN